MNRMLRLTNYRSFIALLAASIALGLYSILQSRDTDKEDISLRPKRPNIVLIYSDDQGWADLGAHRVDPAVHTPNLDKMARDGALFRAGYVTAPQCAPSRAGLLTGRYQQTFGFDSIDDGPLPLDEETIADRLAKLGYISGIVGKWHLSPYSASLNWAKDQGLRIDGNRAKVPTEMAMAYHPAKRGFQQFFVGQFSRYAYNFDPFSKQRFDDIQSRQFEGNRIDIQTQAALQFIKNNREGPFFLYLAYYAPHLPLSPKPELMRKFAPGLGEQRRGALAMINSMDEGVGKIRALLDDLDLTTDTLIFYISDNGAPIARQRTGKPIPGVKGKWNGSLNQPFNGEKGMLTEGGIRVPFIATWPGKIPPNQVRNEPISTLDVAATILEANDRSSPNELHGRPLLGAMKDLTAIPSRPLFWKFWGQAAVRDRNWKYIELSDSRRFLFNLQRDPGESYNLIHSEKARANQLRRLLVAWQESLGTDYASTSQLNDQEKGWFNYYLR